MMDAIPYLKHILDCIIHNPSFNDYLKFKESLR